MAITVSWDNEQKTIISQVFNPPWDWEDFLAAFKRVAELAGEVDYEVSMISDMGGIEQVPANAIMSGSRAISPIPSNVVLCVLIAPSRLMVSLIKIMQSMTHYNKITTASTIERAQLLIGLKIAAHPLTSY